MLPSVPTIYEFFDSWQSAWDTAMDSNYTVSTLISDGPQRFENTPKQHQRQKYGIRKINYWVGTTNTKVHAISGHSDAEIARALFAQADPEEWKDNKDSLAHGSGLPDGVRDEIMSLIYKI